MICAMIGHRERQVVGKGSYGMLSERYRLTRVTAIASLQG